MGLAIGRVVLKFNALGILEIALDMQIWVRRRRWRSSLSMCGYPECQCWKWTWFKELRVVGNRRNSVGSEVSLSPDVVDSIMPRHYNL